MKETLTLDFCDITIYSNYIVVVMKEGVSIVPSHNTVLVDIVNTYFGNSPFVYISHRLYSYSVDPKIYYETVKIQNLKGFAVVSNNFMAKTNAEIEQQFFSKPFKVFNDLESAFTWANELTEKNK